jgi:Leucine-rich repeat (LRR) protein
MIITLAPPQNITYIDLGTSSPKLGGVVDVSDFTNLQEIKCPSHDLTEVKGYADNPNIHTVLIANNQLSGPIPDITGMSSLTNFWVMVNQFTGTFPDISGNPNLQVINVGRNNLTGTLPDISAIGFPNLIRFNVYGNSFTGAIPDMVNIPKLDYLLAHNNNLTDFTGSFPITLRRLLATDNNLTQTAVDNILQAIVDANRTTDMSKTALYIGGTGNSAPSPAGIANINILRGRGWTVFTN